MVYFLYHALRVRSRKIGGEQDEARHRLVEAQALWVDPSRLEVPARMAGELRWQIVGRYGGKTWSAFVTYRGDSIRIISVRRARHDEEVAYFEG